MAQTLQGLYQNLEAQVREKTLGLETERARLAALYEASAFLAEATTMDALAQGFAQQVRRVAKADAVGGALVRRIQPALHAAGLGLPAAARGRRRALPAGRRVRLRQGLRAARDPRDPDPRHEAQPGAGLRTKPASRAWSACRCGCSTACSGSSTCSFAAPVTLSTEETALLDALASHLASALEGLRAEALEREAAVGEERALLARELHDSIAQSLAFLKIQASCCAMRRSAGSRTS
jgi:two-component system nitrate/nitrite sensor histidine kinase NarX